LNELPGLIRDIDDANFMVLRRALAEQFDKAALPLAQAAELLWQGKLASRSSDYLSQLPHEILNIDRPMLIAAAQRLIQVEGGARCLSSRPCPGPPWQEAK